jgi:hypothetical protein
MSSDAFSTIFLTSFWINVYAEVSVGEAKKVAHWTDV